jgi:nitroreductase
MDALEAIRTRHSVSPAFLEGPEPDPATLEMLLDAAVRAPDHGCLRPWRLLIVRGEARTRLGEVLAEALAKRDPTADQAALAKERAKPLRAPLIVVVTVRIEPEHPKIPVVEQVLSAGAAVQNLLLAANTLGIGAKWVSGPGAHDDHVKAALGHRPRDLIAGLVFLGQTTGSPPVVPHASAPPLTSEWTGPVAPGS